jgi:SAM-dependent methyltransferase
MPDCRIDKTANALWNRAAGRWNQLQGEDGDVLRNTALFPWFDEALRSVSGKKILDIGCGTGTLLKRFSAGGAICTGIDVSAEMISIAAQKVESCRFIVADVSKIEPTTLGKYDAITSCFSLQDIADLSAACSVLAGALSDCGVVAIVLEDFAYMNDIDGHLTTKRVWDLDRPMFGSDQGNGNRQRIYWDNGVYTFSWCRPIDAYLKELTQVGLTNVQARAIRNGIGSTRCVGIQARPRLSVSGSD